MRLPSGFASEKTPATGLMQLIGDSTKAAANRKSRSMRPGKASFEKVGLDFKHSV